MVVVNQRLRISPVGVLEHFQNISSSRGRQWCGSLLQHWCHTLRLKIILSPAGRSLSITLRYIDQPVFFLSSSPYLLSLTLLLVHLPITFFSPLLLSFLPIASRRGFSIASSISKLLQSCGDWYPFVLFLVCVCLWRWGVMIEVQICPRLISFRNAWAKSRQNRFLFWSLTIPVFHCIAALLVFKQSVKWQWLEQEYVNRTFAYRKLLYYNVNLHKLSVRGSQNMVTCLQKEETEK